ncbi:hypothetical protein [Microbacterium aurantiacum]|uniref:hypothetical protein n=1 Tax=Microbacterium aurantiacum TaxID=162393 RepID=UPI000C806AC9|nr:hypothetical protein [Microbacterium aurantiacum]
MATTNQHINARNDPDLLDRFVAAAEQANVENASAWVQARMGRLVSVVVEVGGEGAGDDKTVSDVHAYADEVRDAHLAATPARPGANLSAVTDANLTTAITAVQTAEAS